MSQSDWQDHQLHYSYNRADERASPLHFLNQSSLAVVPRPPLLASCFHGPAQPQWGLLGFGSGGACGVTPSPGFVRCPGEQ